MKTLCVVRTFDSPVLISYVRLKDAQTKIPTIERYRTSFPTVRRREQIIRSSGASADNPTVGCLIEFSDHRQQHERIFQPSGAQASVRCYQWVRTGLRLYIEATFSFTVISSKRSAEDRSIRSTNDGKYPTFTRRTDF